MEYGLIASAGCDDRKDNDENDDDDRWRYDFVGRRAASLAKLFKRT